MDQVIHSDFSDTHRDSFSVLMALENETRFWVVPNKKKGGKYLIKLNEGDALVFRSDTWHGGSGYRQRNIRFHCYVDLKFKPNGYV